MVSLQDLQRQFTRVKRGDVGATVAKRAQRNLEHVGVVFDQQNLYVLQINLRIFCLRIVGVNRDTGRRIGQRFLAPLGVYGVAFRVRKTHAERGPVAFAETGGDHAARVKLH